VRSLGIDPKTNAASDVLEEGPGSLVAAEIHPERRPAGITAAGLRETIQVVCQCSNLQKYKYYSTA
jgi:hypothetical protein